MVLSGINPGRNSQERGGAEAQGMLCMQMLPKAALWQQGSPQKKQQQHLNKETSTHRMSPGAGQEQTEPGERFNWNGAGITLSSQRGVCAELQPKAGQSLGSVHTARV